MKHDLVPFFPILMDDKPIPVFQLDEIGGQAGRRMSKKDNGSYDEDVCFDVSSCSRGVLS